MKILRTGVLLILLSVLLVVVGGAIGGHSGLKIALALAVLLNGISYFFSDKIALASSGAERVSPDEVPRLYQVMERLAGKARLPMPKLYVIPEAAPNAFATGRDPGHAAVAVTQGILAVLNRRQLRAVLGHELAHVKNRDTLISMIVAAVAGLISAAASVVRWGLLFGGTSRDDRRSTAGDLAIVIVAPIIALLLQLAISRTREYAADASGSVLTDDPEALADALERISAGAQARPYPFAGPATAHLFIVNPFTAGALASLLSTHPPVEKRVGRLLDLAARLHGRIEEQSHHQLS